MGGRGALHDHVEVDQGKTKCRKINYREIVYILKNKTNITIYIYLMIA